MAGTEDRLRAPTPAELEAAAAVVAAHLTPTPLVPAVLAAPGGGRRVWLKLETFQPTGSFKVRGALAALASLPPDAHAVSASAGNHGLGLCHAARLLDRRVTVVTPADASPAKVAAIEALTAGSRARLVRHGTGYEQAEAEATARVAAEPGAVYVSAYSDAAVIAGQATIVAELDAQLSAAGAPGPATVMVPLGGGGLASGVGLAVAARPGWHLVAAEVTASRAVSAAVAAGHRVEVPVGPSLADGLLGNLEAASPTPAIVGGLVGAGRASLVAVEEAALRAAMRWAFAAHGLVVEGAGAAALAAAMDRPGAPAGGGSDRVPVVVLSGRNITPGAFAEVLVDDG